MKLYDLGSKFWSLKRGKSSSLLTAYNGSIFPLSFMPEVPDANINGPTVSIPDITT